MEAQYTVPLGFRYNQIVFKDINTDMALDQKKKNDRIACLQFLRDTQEKNRASSRVGMGYVICHMSYVLCLMSYVSCLMSFLTYHISYAYILYIIYHISCFPSYIIFYA